MVKRKNGHAYKSKLNFRIFGRQNAKYRIEKKTKNHPISKTDARKMTINTIVLFLLSNVLHQTLVPSFFFCHLANMRHDMQLAAEQRAKRTFAAAAFCTGQRNHITQ